MATVESYFNLFARLAAETGTPSNDSFTELVVLSFVLFTVLYGIAHLMSALFVKHYSTLSYGQQVDWCTRVTSTTHALLTAQAAFRVVLFGEGSLSDTPFHGYTTFVKVYSCVSVGYFLSDFVIIVRHFRNFGTPALNLQYIAHHLFGAVGYSICVNQSMFLYFGMFRLMSESSTPFVAIHYVLNTKKAWAASKAYLLNGAALMFVFFVGRIVALPFYWHTALACWHQFDAPMWLKIAFPIFSLVGDGLNVLWFVGMVKNVRAALTDPPSDAGKESAARFGTAPVVEKAQKKAQKKALTGAHANAPAVPVPKAKRA